MEPGSDLAEHPAGADRTQSHGLGEDAGFHLVVLVEWRGGPPGCGVEEGLMLGQHLAKGESTTIERKWDGDTRLRALLEFVEQRARGGGHVVVGGGFPAHELLERVAQKPGFFLA